MLIKVAGAYWKLNAVRAWLRVIILRFQAYLITKKKKKNMVCVTDTLCRSAHGNRARTHSPKSNRYKITHELNIYFVFCVISYFERSLKYVHNPDLPVFSKNGLLKSLFSAMFARLQKYCFVCQLMLCTLHTYIRASVLWKDV